MSSGKQFQNTGRNRIRETIKFKDYGHNGRCALGVIMSDFGRNGQDDFQASSKLLGNFYSHPVDLLGEDRNLLIEMNDSGFTFDEIADYIDKVVNGKSWRSPHDGTF